MTDRAGNRDDSADDLRELAESEQELRDALADAGARLMACRGGDLGASPLARAAHNRALARIIREDAVDERLGSEQP